MNLGQAMERAWAPLQTHGFARIARSVGLARVRLHDLRHAVATTLVKSTPAYVTSKLLGHSSVHFTANTYQHADEESLERALAGLEEAFSGAPEPLEVCNLFADGRCEVPATGQVRRSSRSEGGPPGNRTPDHRIKSPLLCQLS
jgi:hypothetical protein